VSSFGLDLKRLLLDRSRKLIFDPQAIQVEREVTAHLERGDVPSPPRADTSLFPDVFPRFGEVMTPSGNYGYVRLKSFAPQSGSISGVVDESMSSVES
jgi:hypothetical protein